MYGYVRSCTVMYGYVRLCTVMYGYVRLCTVMYGGEELPCFNCAIKSASSSMIANAVGHDVVQC